MDTTAIGESPSVSVELSGSEGIRKQFQELALSGQELSNTSVVSALSLSHDFSPRMISNLFGKEMIFVVRDEQGEESYYQALFPAQLEFVLNTTGFGEDIPEGLLDGLEGDQLGKAVQFCAAVRKAIMNDSFGYSRHFQEI